MDREVKEIFEYFDKDQDGEIDLNDIDKTCQVIGLGFNKDENSKFLGQINPSFLGKMKLEDFQQIMDKKVFPEMTQEDLYNSFKVFDNNKTGKINTAEFQQVMTQVALANNSLTKIEIAQFMKMADPKNDGYFDYDHFIRNLD